MITLRSIGWAGHAAQMGRGRIYIAYWWESQKKRDCQEYQDISD
jgi:hypothetical protein